MRTANMTFKKFVWIVELFMLAVAVVVVGVACYHPDTADHRRYMDIGVLAIAFSILVRRVEEGEK